VIGAESSLRIKHIEFDYKEATGNVDPAERRVFAGWTVAWDSDLGEGESQGSPSSRAPSPAAA
jgi:hypothetical protein